MTPIEQLREILSHPGRERAKLLRQAPDEVWSASSWKRQRIGLKSFW